MTRLAAIGCLLTIVWAADAGAGGSTSLFPQFQPVGVASVQGLPSDLRWPAGDATKPVVNAVAADIDADGDLDIVANQGSLELAVWVNDGTGRLTRAATPHPAGSGQLAPYPDVGDAAPASSVPVTAGAPSFDAALRHWAAAPLCGSGAPTGPPAVRVPSHSLAICSPRAPPLAVLA